MRGRDHTPNRRPVLAVLGSAGTCVTQVRASRLDSLRQAVSWPSMGHQVGVIVLPLLLKAFKVVLYPRGH